MPSITWSGDGSALYVLGPLNFWRIDPVTGATEVLAAGLPNAQAVWIGG